MKSLLIGIVLVAMSISTASVVLADGPPRSQTKELSVWAPDWVKAAIANRGTSAQITGMTWTNANGWKGEASRLIADDKVWHRQQRRPYQREVYQVSFEKPESYEATVVFEDYGTMVPQASYHPVLVTKVPTEKSYGWNYEEPSGN